jgi:hypothetical protein
MNYIKLIVGVFASLLLASNVFADTTNAPVAASINTNQWVFTLGGGVTTTSGNSQTALGFDIGAGRTFGLDLPCLSEEVRFEGGIRQGIGWGLSSTSTVLSTKSYLDSTLFSYKNVEFDGGGNLGLIYGNISTKWYAAPEALVKYWLRKDVAIYGGADYSFDLNRGRAEDAINYRVGLEFRF